MKKICLFSFFLLAFHSLFGQCCSNGVNLLADYNPDFSAPFDVVPPGFTTDNPYTTVPTPGTYIIVASRNYGACFNSPQADHTTGDLLNGRFLWFDTSPTASTADPDIAWKPLNPNLPLGAQDAIAVTPNTTYVFSCWILDLARNPDCITGGAPLMGLRINGVELAEVDLALVIEPCCPQWTYLCSEWNSGTNTSAIIQIESRRTDGFNDLGIDDVYFGTTAGFDFSLGPDTAICTGAQLTLTNPVQNGESLWSNTSINDTIQINSPGVYWLEVLSNGCTDRDSILVTELFSPAIDLGNDTTFCNLTTFEITPVNTGASISNYLWQNNASTSFLDASNTGLYWLQASNNCGTSTDSVSIQFFVLPDLGNDTLICNNITITLNAGLAQTYLWSNGATTPTLDISSTGVYWLQTNSGQCIGSDTVSVTFYSTPVINLGKDTAFCDNQLFTLTLDTSNAYVWSDGSTASFLNILNTGVYWAETNNGPCFFRDSINVSVISAPFIDLGADISVCLEETIILDAGIANAYLWSDSSTFSSILVSEPGLYWVQTNNLQCIDSDSILISFTNCDCTLALKIPNSFTPNNDGKNDNFIPKEISCVNEGTLKIINRWGSEIFFTNDIKMGWNGKTGNNQCPDGTYYWIIDYTTNTNEQKSKAGFVTLLR